MKIKTIKHLLKILKSMPKSIETTEIVGILSHELIKAKKKKELKKITSDLARRTITAGQLKIGDYCKVYFTESICEVISIDYSYGRTSITLAHDDEVTQVSGHTEVVLVDN